MASQLNSNSVRKEFAHILLKQFQKICKEKTNLKLILWHHNHANTKTRQRYLKNLQANIPDEHRHKSHQHNTSIIYLTCIKRSYTMIKWELSQECKQFFHICRSMWYTTLTNRIMKSYDHHIDVEKSLNKLCHPLMVKKKTPESRNRGTLSQSSKGHIWQTHS